MNHEKNLRRLIARGEKYLSCAMAAKAQENDIKYFYQLSRFFNIVDQLRKEIHLLKVEEYSIYLDLYEKALRLLAIVGDEE